MQKKNNRNKEASGKMILIKVGEVKDNFNSGSVISPHSIWLNAGHYKITIMIETLIIQDGASSVHMTKHL